MTHPQDPNDPFSGIESYRGLRNLTGREPLMALQDPQQAPVGPPRSPLLTGMILGLLLVVVSIALFQLLSDDGDDVAGGATDTTAGGTDTTAPGEGDATDATSSATGATDATGAPGGATTYTAEGEPIPVAELLLAADGVGPIELGQPAAPAVGRLIASLGEPDEDTGPQPATGDWGVCEGETERIIRWGPFAVIIVVDPDGTETFGAYRLDLMYGGLSSETVDLATLSGLQAGTSLRRLEQIYDGFIVERLDDPILGPVWNLSSSETGNQLLWGPLTADDSVRGIYSPDACGRF